MPTLIPAGTAATPVPTPFPDRRLVGMPLLINGEAPTAYQKAFAIPCGVVTLHPPLNKDGRYYQGTEIDVVVNSLYYGTRVILGGANSSGGSTPTGTFHARNSQPYSITAKVIPCSRPIAVDVYNTYSPSYYDLKPTPIPMPTPTLPPLLPRPYSVESISRYLADGQRLYHLAQFDEAILEFDQILLGFRIEPEFRQEAYTWRAKSQIALGNWSDALLDVGEALAIDPTDLLEYQQRNARYQTLNIELFRLRSKIYMELDSYEEVISASNEVLQRDSSGTASDYHSRGYAHYMREQYRRATRDLTAAILIEPTAQRYELRGAAYYYAGQGSDKIQYQKALSDFNQALRMDPTDNLIEWRKVTNSKINEFD